MTGEAARRAAEAAADVAALAGLVLADWQIKALREVLDADPAADPADRPIRALVMDLCRALGHDPSRVSGIVADVESLEVTEYPALDGRGPRTLRTEYRLNDRPRPSGGAG